MSASRPVETARAGIAHLDTGVAPALVARVVDSLHLDPRGRPLDSFPADDNGHGTATASLVLESAPDGAGLYVVKALDGGDVVTRILSGLCWIATRPVRVACLAIGVKRRTPIFGPALAALRARDILPVVSVGNGGAGRAFSPGWYPGVLSVGAVDDEGEVHARSGSDNDRQTRCLAPALLAPGVDVLAMTPTGRRRRFTGTSMAAATVAGHVATLLQEFPRCSVHQIERALLDTALPSACGRRHHYRDGVVQLDAARRWLTQAPAVVARRVPELVGREAFVDPRLMRQCRRTEGPVRGLLQWRAGAEHILDGVDGERVRTMPLARTAVLRAAPGVWRGLQSAPEVCAVHAADIDFLNA